MSFETRNIEVVLYNLLKNVQCTLIKFNILNTNKTINGNQARLPAKILNLYTILSATTGTTLELLNITYSIARF